MDIGLMKLDQIGKMITILGLTLFGLLAYKSTQLVEKRNRVKRIRFRNPQTVDTIYANYYQMHNIKKSKFIEIWLETASCLHIQPEQMRPEDKLMDYARDASLNGIQLMNSDIESIEDLVNLKINNLPTSYSSKFDTIDDVIQVLLKN